MKFVKEITEEEIEIQVPAYYKIASAQGSLKSILKIEEHKTLCAVLTYYGVSNWSWKISLKDRQLNADGVPFLPDLRWYIPCEESEWLEAIESAKQQIASIA